MKRDAPKLTQFFFLLTLAGLATLCVGLALEGAVELIRAVLP